MGVALLEVSVTDDVTAVIDVVGATRSLAEQAQVAHLPVSGKIKRAHGSSVVRARKSDDLTVRVDIRRLAERSARRPEIDNRIQRHCGRGRAKQEHRTELQALSNGSSVHDPLPWTTDLPVLSLAPGRPVRRRSSMLLAARLRNDARGRRAVDRSIDASKQRRLVRDCPCPGGSPLLVHRATLRHAACGHPLDISYSDGHSTTDYPRS